LKKCFNCKCNITRLDSEAYAKAAASGEYAAKGFHPEESIKDPSWCFDCFDAEVSRQTAFVATEVAYHVPAKGWKRKVARTQAQLDKLLAKLEEEGVTETATRDAQ
jgi:hypothetical protein